MSFASLALGDGDKLSFEHLLDPSLEPGHDLLFNLPLDLFLSQTAMIDLDLMNSEYILGVLFALQLFDNLVPEVFVYIHMNLVNQPTQELMRVMMLVIVEQSIACPDAADESPMVHDATRSL